NDRCGGRNNYTPLSSIFTSTTLLIFTSHPRFSRLHLLRNVSSSRNIYPSSPSMAPLQIPPTISFPGSHSHCPSLGRRRRRNHYSRVPFNRLQIGRGNHGLIMVHGFIGDL